MTTNKVVSLAAVSSVSGRRTEPTQPLLLESAEFRRRVDADRADTLAKIQRVKEDLAAADIARAQLTARLRDLEMIVEAADAVLSLIQPVTAAPTPDFRDDGSAAEGGSGA